MKTPQYDAICYTESAERVAKGWVPKLRTEAPGLTIDSKVTVYLAAGRDGGSKAAAIRIIGRGHEVFGKSEPGGVSVNVDLTAADLMKLFTVTSLVDVCFADRRSVAVAAKILGRSKDRNQTRVGKIVSYLSKVPAMNHCAVLTSALAKKYWTPGGASHSDDLEMWTRVFNVDTDQPRFGQAKDLCAIAEAGNIPVFPSVNFRSSAASITSALLRGNRSRVDAFNQLQSHNDQCDAIEGSDPILYERGLLSGSTAKINPIRTEGARVIAEVSTPFKLRPGHAITLFGPEMKEGLPAMLLGLDFDPVMETLTATFGPVGSTSTKPNSRRKQSGFDVLTSLGSRDKSFYGINEPFLGSGRTYGPRRRGQNGLTAGSNREIPLDVSLAAAD